MSLPNLSALAVRERSVTLFFLLLSVVAGFYAFSSLGRAEDPAFTVRAMVVSVVWPGATPEVLQNQVVDRLEKRVQEVAYTDTIETTIRPGQAAMVIRFQDSTPSEKVPDLFYQVRKRMLDERPNLPRGVIGPIVNDDFADVYFSLLALTAPGMPMRELTREAESIRDRLQRLPGLQKAQLLAERPERVYLEFDQDRLNNLGLSAEEVLQAIEANNRLQPLGFVDLAGPRVYVRSNIDLSDLERLTSVPLRIGDQLITVSDLAEVRLGYEDPLSYIVRSNGEDAILLGVVMRAGENGLEFGERLREFVSAEQGRLPLGMSIQTLTDQAEAITQAVDLFQVKFLVALVVVMGVSILAIGLRAGLVVGIAIPVTLGLTFLLMKMAGINLDRITLGALIIALGLLVDDAIIAIEMMIVKMESGWDRVRAASHAWSVTAAPMLFGTLVTVAGFVPIGFAQSGVGEYTGNIFWVLAFSLLISWVVAVTFTPYLGVKLLPDYTGHTGQDLYQSAFYQRLRRVITACVQYRKTVVFITVGLLAISAFGMATQVQKQFFPSSDRPEVLISVYAPQGSAIATTDQSVRRLEAILMDMPEVKSLSAYIGAGAPRFFVSANPEQPDPAFAKLIAIGQDVEGRDRIISALETRIAAGEFPEARVRVTRLLYGPPVVWPVSFRVLGPESDQLREIAHQIRTLMTGHPNIVMPHLEWDERVPTLYLDMDPENLGWMGLTPAEVARQLQFQLRGVAVTELRQGIRSVQLVARNARGEVIMPEDLEIKTRDGRKLSVQQLGKWQVRYEDPVIKRYNRDPFLAVQADVEGAQPPDVTKEIWSAMTGLREQLPEGYRIEIGGTVEQSAKANASIQTLQPVMLALMLIFIMLQMRSFIGTLTVLATAPLGLIGAVLALLLFNQPFGFTALLGLIGLGGILMRNTMILTQQVQDNFKARMAAREAVVEAAVQRARPVVLTALAAVLAFVPLTFDLFWGPLAYVLIGGVAVGTLITLLFVPALYALWFRLQMED
ncbi:MAG: efflux RND transporter permease subunit [Pseudomonadota bacterium]|jgi:multidrug efflux pump subunit AcrB|uniref:Cation efflux system protein n=3 Tax=Marinobacter TaxID=2742 RepID=A0A137S573_9GAMM|nr:MULTISPECIES: efflux RND transporter permease subunit [Marinobacter]MDX5440271.1 efflux RND transporter permease subunit [Alteromonadaceae bacterium]PKM04427.1 MAG: AcrB/AcrD/AcrF family protein [Gammaproteobacteria bacterium HGW-Gammaproteobacteria-6]WBU41684.1 efflux RND transporter permease subunit [Marinobacter alkaliphilus]AMQ88819.1 multidrug transporter [Marinobacter sp. LQ44]KAE8545082.1 RND efflux system, inner membrane transporter [Marinobacter nauticus]